MTHHDATEDAFRTQLLSAGYMRTTADAYLAVLRRAASQGAVPAGVVAPAAARLWLAWEGHPPDHGLTRAAELIRAPASDGFGGIASVANRRAAQLRVKRQARSLPEASWYALLDALSENTDATDAALRVVAETGLRVGDVLAVTQGELARGKATGVIRLDAKGGEQRVLPWDGAPEAWGALLERFPNEPTLIVAELVTNERGASPVAGKAAYRRLDRRLKKHAVTLKITDGVAHLHRLRRTTAVAALRETQDIVAVKDLLGHKALSSTARYLDEARPDVVAKLQQKIRQRTRE